MPLDLKQALGLAPSNSLAQSQAEHVRLQRYLNLQLIALGFPSVEIADKLGISRDAESLLATYAQRLRLAEDIRSPVDGRIEAFFREHFADCDLPERIRLPQRTLVLQRHGVAREASLPFQRDSFSNALVQSYRVKNGVLHNPRSDRRTTQGTFHVAEGGLPIPARYTRRSRRSSKAWRESHASTAFTCSSRTRDRATWERALSWLAFSNWRRPRMSASTGIL